MRSYAAPRSWAWILHYVQDDNNCLPELSIGLPRFRIPNPAHFGLRGRFVQDPAHSKSVGLLLITALCWSLAGVLFKFVDWPPLAAAGTRSLIAALFLLAVRGRSLRFTWSPLQLGTALAYAGCTLLFAVANKLTTAANAILLQYTAPVWIALLGSWLLGERSTRAD